MIPPIIIDARVGWTRILLISKIGIILRPGDSGPLLFDSCYPGLRPARQSRLPTGGLEKLLVGSEIWRDLLSPGIVTRHTVAGDRFVMVVPILGPVAAFRKARTFGLARR